MFIPGYPIPKTFTHFLPFISLLYIFSIFPPTLAKINPSNLDCPVTDDAHVQLPFETKSGQVTWRGQINPDI